MQEQQILEWDRQHIWHPYSAINSRAPLFTVKSASGVYLHLHSGKKLIDGMSSWWSVIHGYNHPALNAALESQLKDMAHVMFGGLTHEPAVKLAKALVNKMPSGLNKLFYCDSGSVAVEVALKMAVQYWLTKGQPDKVKFLSLRNGYHGDTFGAMSVCDPVTGMHHLFKNNLMQQIFTESPACQFGQPCHSEHLESFRKTLTENQHHIAAVILEPIVQGTGGMRFYSAEFLTQVRELCDQHNTLLIADEIATGFGRTGKFFACEHSGITPDILCIGKAMTGGYLSFAATACTDHVAETICQGEAGVFMHGPTFMANPLACAVALKNLTLLEENHWDQQVHNIESWLTEGLSRCKKLESVADVRTLGAIGVVEMKKPVCLEEIQPKFVDAGIWLRPFGKLIYTMPPYITSKIEMEHLTQSIFDVIKSTYHSG